MGGGQRLSPTFLGFSLRRGKVKSAGRGLPSPTVERGRERCDFSSATTLIELRYSAAHRRGVGRRLLRENHIHVGGLAKRLVAAGEPPCVEFPHATAERQQ